MRNLLSVAILLLCSNALAQAASTSFSDLAVGDTFSIGDRITSEGISFDVVSFLSTSGSANVIGIDGIFPSPSLGPGVGVEFVLDSEVQYISLHYLLSGPTNGIVVNGVSTTTPNKFSDQDGITIGGVSITANLVPQILGEEGELILSGPISSFIIGGSELFIDDVSITAVPEPSSAMFCIAVSVSLFTRWRRM